MKIGDRIYVHGYVDEIRNDCVIIRNEGGYFGTAKSEIVEVQSREDIVSVVRCKDCKLYPYRATVYADDTPIMEVCTLPIAGIDPINGFCSLGEKKEE